MALEETVAHFMAGVLTFTRAITEEVVQRLQTDRDELVGFFSQHCKPDKADKRWQHPCRTSRTLLRLTVWTPSPLRTPLCCRSDQHKALHSFSSAMPLYRVEQCTMCTTTLLSLGSTAV